MKKSAAFITGLIVLGILAFYYLMYKYPVQVFSVIIAPAIIYMVYCIYQLVYMKLEDISAKEREKLNS